MDEVKLLPCPAGHENGRVIGGPGTRGGPKYWAGCDDCNWRAWGDTQAEAIAAWNTRAIEATRPADEVVERVARALNRSSGRGHEHDWESYVVQARAAIAAMKDAASD